VVSKVPPVVASPYAEVARSTSLQVAPPPTVAVPVAGLTENSRLLAPLVPTP
jgi:hypothetical protein